MVSTVLSKICGNLRHLWFILLLLGAAAVRAAASPEPRLPRRPRRRLRRRSTRPGRRRNRRALTCSIFRRRAARSPTATALPLAQNKLSYNLTIDFPTPLDFSDTQVLDYARQQIRTAEKVIGRSLNVSDDAILQHYHNRGFLPFEIAQNLSDDGAGRAERQPARPDSRSGRFTFGSIRTRAWRDRSSATPGGRVATPTASLITTRRSGRKRRDARDSSRPSTPC